jgi:hypothetical protein
MALHRLPPQWRQNRELIRNAIPRHGSPRPNQRTKTIRKLKTGL